jgi:hypothetical protein
MFCVITVPLCILNFLLNANNYVSWCFFIAVELQRHLLSIQNGHRLTKVRRNGKTFVRFFRADDTLLTFGYNDSKKSFRSHRNLKDQSTGMHRTAQTFNEVNVIF